MLHFLFNVWTKLKILIKKCDLFEKYIKYKNIYLEKTLENTLDEWVRWDDSAEDGTEPSFSLSLSPVNPSIQDKG